MMIEILTVNPREHADDAKGVGDRKSVEPKVRLEVVAGLLREKGIASTSVSDVMAAAGLTNGGIHRDFSSADDLVTDAFRQAVDQSFSELATLGKSDTRQPARGSYIKHFLSRRQLANRETSCPLQQ